MTRRPLRRFLPLMLLPTLLASSALGAVPKPELGSRSHPSRTTEERALARLRHWETQRAYPALRIPDGAYAEANAAFRLIPAVHPAWDPPGAALSSASPHMPPASSLCTLR